MTEMQVRVKVTVCFQFCVKMMVCFRLCKDNDVLV